MLCSISINSSGPTTMLDLTKNLGGVQVVEAGEAQPDLDKVCLEVASPEFQAALVLRVKPHPHRLLLLRARAPRDCQVSVKMGYSGHSA